MFIVNLRVDKGNQDILSSSHESIPIHMLQMKHLSVFEFSSNVTIWGGAHIFYLIIIYIAL